MPNNLFARHPFNTGASFLLIILAAFWWAANGLSAAAPLTPFVLNCLQTGIYCATAAIALVVAYYSIKKHLSLSN
ncbi:MAG: hypothetical protein EOO61_16270 [Hymenobacter sp.]|nr:MAG: hypothetical protein EOO61_16270 [Hymenobacter sp.]